MPVSKHRKKSKQNSFGIRKAERWADEQHRLQLKRQEDRIMRNLADSEKLYYEEENIGLNRRIMNITNEEEVAQNEETE